MRQFKNKAIIAIMAILTLGYGLSIGAVSSPAPKGGVPIESSLAVANVTAGHTNYYNSVSAKVDEVVKISVWYHNPEHPDSNKIAENVRVQIAIPGTNTNTHQVTSRVGGTNTNTKTGLVTVNTAVNTNLEYIPGTAYRRYNKGTTANPNWVTEKISDSVVSTGYVISKLNPCWDYQETITVKARVLAPTLSIVKRVRLEGERDWKISNTAKPGDTLEYLITFENKGNTRLNNVIIRDSLPVHLTFVPGSARLININYPNGYPLSDKIISAGVNIGNYSVGSNAHVTLRAKIPTTMVTGGTYTFKNVGVAKADGIGEYYNIAETKVTYEVTIQQRVSINIFKFHDRDGNKIQNKGEGNLGDWQFRITGPRGYNNTVTTNANGQAIVTNLDQGTYTVEEILKSGWINTTGVRITRTVTTDPATQNFVFGNMKKTPPAPTPTPTPTPVPIPPSKPQTELPKTGPIETAGILFATFALSGSGIAYKISKKKLLDALKTY